MGTPNFPHQRVYLCFWVRGLASLPEVSWLFASQIGVFHCKSAGNASNFLKLGAPKPLASQTISLTGGYPQIIHFSRIFPLNHPFRRSPILGNQRIRPPRCRREVLHRCVDLPSGAEMGRQIGQSFYGETLDIKMMVI